MHVVLETQEQTSLALQSQTVVLRLHSHVIVFTLQVQKTLVLQSHPTAVLALQVQVDIASISL